MHPPLSLRLDRSQKQPSLSAGNQDSACVGTQDRSGGPLCSAGDNARMNLDGDCVTGGQWKRSDGSWTRVKGTDRTLKFEGGTTLVQQTVFPGDFSGHGGESMFLNDPRGLA